MRFVIGRPGWRVEARASAGGGTDLRVTAADPKTGAKAAWRVARTREGLVVADAASGRRLPVAPTMRDALVEVWEATTAGDAPD